MVELNELKERPNNKLSGKRVSELQRIDKKKVRNQIELLIGKPNKNQKETDLLAKLNDDLKSATEYNNGELGTRSIFYDKDWNLKGVAPPHHRNIPYNPETFKRRSEVKVRLGSLEDIKIPSEMECPK